jgi:hypothetical protein
MGADDALLPFQSKPSRDVLKMNRAHQPVAMLNVGGQRYYINTREDVKQKGLQKKSVRWGNVEQRQLRFRGGPTSAGSKILFRQWGSFQPARTSREKQAFPDEASIQQGKEEAGSVDVAHPS